jgi:hypothetical protein
MTNKELKKMILKEMFHMKDKMNNPYKMGDLKKDETLVIGASEPKEPEYEGNMAKSNLYRMAKSATMLHNIIQDDENLEPWVQEKIAVASSMIQSVANYLEYQKVSGK